MAAGPDVDISNLGFFLSLALDAYLKVFPNSDWVNLGVPRNIWMSSFHNTKEFDISIVGSKVMALGSELTHFAWFSRYLNRFNSDFDPWIVVEKGI